MADVDITFYFDFVSPFSYVAYKLLKEVRSTWNINIIPVPVSVAHIVGCTGGRGPASIPAKRAFLGQDLRRTCSLYDIPIQPPADFLSVPMRNANLAAIAASKNGPDHAEKLMDVIWDAFFGHGNKEPFITESMEELKKLLKESNIVGVDELVNLASSEETSKAFNANKESAIREGAFGVPTMVVTREDGEKAMFFGSDRLHHIAAFIHTEMSVLFTPPVLKHSKI